MFVTVLAWLALLLAGFSTVMGLVQSALVLLASPLEAMGGTPAQLPAAFAFIFDSFQWVTLTLTALWATTFGCALALLHRREWARKAFIGLLLMGATLAFAVAALQQTAMGQVVGGVSHLVGEGATMVFAMRVTSALFALAFVATLVWLAVRLHSAPIRAEFQDAV